MTRLAVGAALVCLLAACGRYAVAPHPLTTAEAERLALVRYTNYTAKISSVLARIPTPAGTLVLDGRVDFVSHIGHASLTTEGRADPASTGLLQWNPHLIAFHQGVTPDLPPDGWQFRRLQDKASSLDAALLLLLNLAADRPDNPQLLQQSSARWLRADTIGGTPVDVFEGPTQPGKPARLTYWVDEASHLRRLDAHIADTTATVDLTPGAPPITPLPAITAS